MAKEIKYGSEARAALGAGVDKLANTVRVRLTILLSQNYTQDVNQLSEL